MFTDSRARRNLSALNTELQDVQRIMVQNIDDVLQRGVVLSGKVNHCCCLITFKWEYCFPNEWNRILCISFFLFRPHIRKRIGFHFLGCLVHAVLCGTVFPFNGGNVIKVIFVKKRIFCFYKAYSASKYRFAVKKNRVRFRVKFYYQILHSSNYFSIYSPPLLRPYLSGA